MISSAMTKLPVRVARVGESEEQNKSRTIIINLKDMEEKLITVTGKGTVYVKPDVTRLDLSLTSIHDTYEEAYDQAKSSVDKLTVVMGKCGLPANQPKTIKLDINKKTKSEYDKYGHYTNEVFVGFELSHRVKIDLGMDNVLLNKVVKLIGENLKQAEIKIGYTVKDARPHQLRMLEKAVKDARDKAEIMAKSCGCRLGEVKSINYSVQEIIVYSEARMIHSAEEAIGCNPESLDITPDDLGASEMVSVVWYLANDNKE